MLLLLLYLGSVLVQAKIPNVFWCPCLIISFDVGVSAGEVLEGYMGFEKFCPAESYIRYENALFALPRLYKVYAKNKKVLQRRKECTSQYRCRGRRRA